VTPIRFLLTQQSPAAARAAAGRDGGVPVWMSAGKGGEGASPALPDGRSASQHAFPLTSPAAATTGVPADTIHGPGQTPDPAAALPLSKGPPHLAAARLEEQHRPSVDGETPQEVFPTWGFLCPLLAF